MDTCSVAVAVVAVVDVAVAEVVVAASRLEIVARIAEIILLARWNLVEKQLAE